MINNKIAQNKLYKDIIDENIPADLLKAYKQSSVYPSQKRPGDSHREITDNNYARGTNAFTTDRTGSDRKLTARRRITRSANAKAAKSSWLTGVPR